MMYLSLSKGTIVLQLNGGKKVPFGYPKHKTKTTAEAIGAYLAKHPEVTSFVTSSSVNHPHEYGFSRNFDISKVMGEARRVSFKKLAVRVQPGPINKAVKTLKAAAKNYGRFPLPVLFCKSSRKQQDILVIFSESNEFENFLLGILYASNLVEIRRGRSTTGLRRKARSYLESQSLTEVPKKRRAQGLIG